MTALDARKLIKGLDSLPTIPALLGRILSVVNSDDASAEDLYRLISHDQALADRVVKMANSAVFGHPGEVKDIRQAMIFLGNNRIRSIAAGMSVMHTFPVKNSFSMKNLWIHSYEVAFLAETLSRIVSMTCPCECFLSGLLHDIGRIIFCRIDHGRFFEITTTDDMLEREGEYFGCTHADAGSWFAETNNMPLEIVSTIRFHHKPSLSPDHKVSVSVVSLAEAMVRTLSPRVEDDGIWTEEHDALLLELGLRDNDLTYIGENFFGARLEIERFFST